jgi:hypothetical protein
MPRQPARVTPEPRRVTGEPVLVPGGAGHTLSAMTWTWQYQKADGTAATARGLPRETFGSQGDAETWLGEHWRSLLESGVDQVSLLDDGRTEYGPMSLHPQD